MTARPQQLELEQFATLISDTEIKGAPLPDLPTPILLEKLDYHGIALLAAEKGRLPLAMAPIVSQRRAQMVANSTLKQTAIIELFDALAASNLSNCVLFKGSALAHSLYPQPWLRPRSDTDCLIDIEDFAAVEAVLTSLGYRKLFAIEGRYVSYQTTFSKPLVGQSTMDIDLHWRINNRQALANSYTASELNTDGSTLDELSSSIPIPSNVDSLLIASLHRLGHHQSEERLAWLYDIHLLAKSFTLSDWSKLVRKARAKRLCAVTHDALNTCRGLLASPIPEDVTTDLSSSSSEPSALFLQRDLPEWRYFINDLVAMNSFGERVGFLSETLFPSPAYIRQRMGTQSAIAGYLKRLVRGIKRVVGG